MPQKRYADELIKEIEAWQKKISDLESRGEKLDQATKAEFLELMTRINDKTEEVQKIVSDLRKGEEIDKSRLRSKIEALLADLNQDYRDALSHYH